MDAISRILPRIGFWASALLLADLEENWSELTREVEMFHSVSYAIFKALSQGPINGALSLLLLFKFKTASLTQITYPVFCTVKKEKSSTADTSGFYRLEVVFVGHVSDKV